MGYMSYIESEKERILEKIADDKSTEEKRSQVNTVPCGEHDSDGSSNKKVSLFEAPEAN